MNIVEYNISKIIFFFAGEPEASFTKDEMQQGKHQEYEKKLYEQYNVVLRYGYVINIIQKFVFNCLSLK